MSSISLSACESNDCKDGFEKFVKEVKDLYIGIDSDESLSFDDVEVCVFERRLEMQKLQLFTIAMAMFCLLYLVSSSHAIEIEEFPSDTEDYTYNGYTYHMAYVRTDNPIYQVSWYIEDKWVYGETLDSTTSYAPTILTIKYLVILKGKSIRLVLKCGNGMLKMKNFVPQPIHTL